MRFRNTGVAYNPGGAVDTLNLLFDKLDALLTESQGYYETFLDINNMYKRGEVTDREFFQKLGDYVVAYSALEFLAVKVMFEIRKSLQSGGGMTQSPGLMPGVGQPGLAGTPPRAGTTDNPVGGPPGIVSAAAAFSQPGTLPTPDPALVPKTKAAGDGCPSCGAALKPNAKFCTACGYKI